MADIFFASCTLGYIFYFTYKIANDYYHFHPDKDTRITAYTIKQVIKLLTCLYVPYMLILLIKIIALIGGTDNGI